MNGSRGMIHLGSGVSVFQAPNPGKRTEAPKCGHPERSAAKSKDPVKVLNVMLRDLIRSLPVRSASDLPVYVAASPVAPFSTSLGMTAIMYVANMKSFWLVKQEPSSYSWSDFVADGETSWTGVRNFTARNNLRKMQKGDEVLFYHSGDEKGVVGTAKVKRTAYPDPTAKEGDWSTVDLAALKPLQRPVALREIKDNPRLGGIVLIRQSRLSVMPLTDSEFREIVRMSDQAGTVG
jgi:predicted RNA-binding protein with PUA-like domain